MIVRALLIAAVFAVAAGCQTHIMDAELVSMTEQAPPPSFRKGAAVEEKWCQGDKPAKTSADKRYGLMDQVVLKAQKKHGARYIAEAGFYRKGNCLTVKGFAVK